MHQIYSLTIIENIWEVRVKCLLQISQDNFWQKCKKEDFQNNYFARPALIKKLVAKPYEEEICGMLHYCCDFTLAQRSD